MNIASQLWSLVPGPVRAAAQVFTDATSSWAGRTVVAHMPNFVPEGMRKGISQFCGVEEAKREAPKLSPFEALPKALLSKIGGYLKSADFHAVVRVSRTVSKTRVEQLMGNEQAVGDLMRSVGGDIEKLLPRDTSNFPTPIDWMRYSIGEYFSPSKPRFTTEELKTICRGIKTVELKKCSFTPRMMKLIIDFFPTLESLDMKGNFWDSGVSGPVLKQISRLKKLKHLKLTMDSRFSCDKGLQAIVDQSATTLETLHIQNMTVSTGYQHLKALTQLRALTLPFCSDADLQLLRHLPHLRELNLHRCWQITTAGFQVIAECARELQVLNLSDCTQLRDADLEALAKLTELRMLLLKHCSHITNIGIAHLAPLTKLVHLDLMNCPELTDEAMNVIRQFVHLDYLNLSWCRKITDGGVAALEPLVHLKTLLLAGCHTITNAALVSISRHLELEVLSLKHCNKITDLTALRSLIHLRKLMLADCWGITRAGLQACVSLQSLEHLNLQGLFRINDYLQVVAQFRNLKSLNLMHCNAITSREVAHLLPLVKLQKLVLSFCKKVDDEALIICSRLPKLEKLDLYGCNVTNSGLQYLRPLSRLRELNTSFNPGCTSYGEGRLQNHLSRLQIVHIRL